MSLVTEDIKASATEIHYDHKTCHVRSKSLLREVGLPEGLLPLEDIQECGYVKETGFVWLKQRNKKKHRFHKIGRLVTYDTEVTGYVQKAKITRLTGVKTKELLVPVNVGEIVVNESPSGMITFKANSGLFRTFPAAAFEIEEVEEV